MSPFAKLFRSTAFKLTFAILALSAIGSGLVLGIVAWQVTKVVDAETAAGIQTEATSLADQYELGGLRRLGAEVALRSRVPGPTLYLLTDPAGEPLAGNIGEMPAHAIDKAGVTATRYNAPDATHTRMALIQVFPVGGGFHLLVGHDLGDRARIGGVMVRALASSLIFLAGLAALCSLFVARRVLRRIDAMNRSAHAIMAGDLAQRLPVSGSGDELDRLALGLNNMLARISNLVSGLREVSDNIAHDLRTPLTRLRNHAEEALRLERSAPEYRAAIERTIEESDGLIRIFDALLMIARAEAGPDRAGFLPIDLGKVVEGVAELYEPVAEEKGIALSVTAPPGVILVGNRELIGQAVANLIDNALKYGAGSDGASNAIAVSAHREGRDIEIVVSDHGPAVSAAARTRVFDRFVRLEGARSRPGFGLGLSLAAAVARLHGGIVRLEDNKPGLKVIVSLPSAASLPAPAGA